MMDVFVSSSLEACWRRVENPAHLAIEETTQTTVLKQNFVIGAPQFLSN